MITSLSSFYLTFQRMIVEYSFLLEMHCSLDCCDNVLWFSSFFIHNFFLYSIFGTFLSALKSATTTALHNYSYYSTPNYHHLSLGCHDGILCQTYPFTPLIKSLWRQYMKCKINPPSIKSLQDLASFHYTTILPCIFIRVIQRNNKRKWWW